MLKNFREFTEKHSRGLLTGGVLLLLCLMAPGLVLADQKSDIKSQIQNEKETLQQKQNERNDVNVQMRALDDEIAVKEQNLVRLAEEIVQTEDGIAAQERKIEELQKKIEKNQAILGERLCLIYEEGECNYLQVLLQAASLQDFLTRVDYLSAILDNDQALIEETNHLLDEAEVEKQRLEEQIVILEQQKTDEAKAKVELEEKRAEKAALLASLEVDIEALRQSIESAESELERIIQREEAARGTGAVSGGTGVFMWPSNASRAITDDYGWRFHPILKVNKLHTGMDIGAGYGTSILAADGGTVIFVGWSNGYGNTTIISHGNGLSTLYGHQSSFSVSQGQTVQRGQVIGKVGSTGWSTGPHLHFEVRVNGTAVNPHNYVN